MAKKSNKSEEAALEKDKAATYNEFKEFEGRRYTGMKVGRRHKWHYDQGVWEEKKVIPLKPKRKTAAKKKSIKKAA